MVTLIDRACSPPTEIHLQKFVFLFLGDFVLPFTICSCPVNNLLTQQIHASCQENLFYRILPYRNTTAYHLVPLMIVSCTVHFPSCSWSTVLPVSVRKKDRFRFAIRIREKFFIGAPLILMQCNFQVMQASSRTVKHSGLLLSQCFFFF